MATKNALNVDPKLVAAAVKRVMPLVKKIPKELQLPEAEIREVGLDGSAHAVRTKSLKEGSREGGAPVVFGGDLTIEGSFDIGCVCVILGNLKVDGVIEAMHDESVLIVGGSIEARGINCTDHVHAAGAIKAEVVFVEIDGKLTAGQGLEADLIILEHAIVKVDAKMKVKEKIVLDYPEPTGIDELIAVLDQRAFGTVPGEPFLFAYTNLFSVLRRGKPWRRVAAAKAGEEDDVRSRRAPGSVIANANANAKPAKKLRPAKKGKIAKNGARTFELVEGASKKFWAIATSGSALKTRYGRIGTEGQQTTKSFGSPAEAREAADKLVREKTRKGYVEKR